MKTQILEEINRYREIMSLKPLTIINESKEKSILLEINITPLLKKFGLETADKALRELIEKEATSFLKSELKRGVKITSLRNSNQSVKKIPKETIDSMISQAEKSTGKTLNATEKLTIEQELRKIMSEEVMKLADNVGKDFAEKIPKQKTKEGTWTAIKNHFGKNWKKYAAAGILALIFAYHYPGETPPDDVPVVPDPTPSPSPCPVGDVGAVEKFHDWLDNYVPNWHDKYGKLEGSVQKGYGVCGPRTKKWWALKKDDYLKEKTETNPVPPPTPTPTTTINQTTSGGDYLTDF